MQAHPGLDQAELATIIAYDRATTGGVIDRLVDKALVRRDSSEEDRRVRLLTIEPSGEEVLRTADHVIQRIENQILSPLGGKDRKLFLSLLKTLVTSERAESAANRVQQ